MFKMASWPNNIYVVDACSVVWKVACKTNMVMARMPDHGFLLTMLDTSNVRMIFPMVLWICLMIALD